MNRFLTLLAIGGLTFGLLGVASGSARADDCRPVAGVVINNPTDNQVSYQFRWGNGAWTNFTLAPGQSWYHYIDMHHGRAPTPSIRFDNAQGRTVRYDLDFYKVTSDTLADGDPYNFDWPDDGQRLDLFTAD